MDESTLNSTQKFILATLREKLGTSITNKWLFLRNKHFQNKAPVDFLLSENYAYFDYILSDQ